MANPTGINQYSKGNLRGSKASRARREKVLAGREFNLSIGRQANGKKIVGPGRTLRKG